MVAGVPLNGGGMQEWSVLKDNDLTGKNQVFISLIRGQPRTLAVQTASSNGFDSGRLRPPATRMG